MANLLLELQGLPQQPQARQPVNLLAELQQPAFDLESFDPAGPISQIAPQQAPQQSRFIPPEFQPQAAIVSGAIAEPIAGLAGLISAPFVGSEQATRNIEATRQALTFQPDVGGRAGLERVGEILQPVTGALQAAERGLGEAGFQIAGPVGGAIGATIPTVLLEALGLTSVSVVDNPACLSSTFRC